jgi:hypothetical protein
MAYFTLDELRIASPCTVPWSSMQGSDHVRFCGDCEKHVYQLSMLTRAEANELIREKEGNLCVAFYKRFDGTIITGDCPKGLRTLRRTYLKARARVFGAALALWGSLGLSASSCSTSAPRTEGQFSGLTALNDSTFFFGSILMGQAYVDVDSVSTVKDSPSVKTDSTSR